MHQQHAADTLLTVLRAVQHTGRRLEHARVDAGEGERTDERVGHDLERQRRHRCIVARRQRDRLIGAHLHALDVFDVGRRRQVVHDGIEHGLHALVLEGRAAQDRHERIVDRALADALDQRRVVGLLTVEELLHGIVILLDGHIEQLGAVVRGFFLHVVGNLDDLELRAERLFQPDDGLVGNQVDQALVLALGADRELRHQRLGAEAIDDHVDGAIEVRARAIHLVDEADARHAVLVGLAPHRLGLRLDAGH